MMSRESLTDGHAHVFDLLGIGFGPSNLALAIALHEHNTQIPLGRALSTGYLERQTRFGWHRGMLIDGPIMQVPFLKDLATLRNPLSRFSFISYLKSKGRLNDFINDKCWFPSRIEFNDYLEWAAGEFDRLVEYGCDVVKIRPLWEEGIVTCFEVVAQHVCAKRATRSYLARNVALAMGLEPCLPDRMIASEHVWHNCELVPRVAGLAGAKLRRIVVVGAGQSAAESTEYLHRMFPGAEVYALFSHYGYSPLDDSPYVNRIFDPDAVDTFYESPDAVKQMLLARHGNTSYSVVDIGLIKSLYGRAYQEGIVGDPRLRILDLSRIVAADETHNRVSISLESLPTGEISRLDADVLVYATGYRPIDPATLLGELRDHCEHDAAGRLNIKRNYRVGTASEIQAGIYLQGPTEHTHGISSSLLSNIAVRAGEIVEAVAGSASGNRPESSLERLADDYATQPTTNGRVVSSHGQ